LTPAAFDDATDLEAWSMSTNWPLERVDRVLGTHKLIEEREGHGAAAWRNAL
jgi:hypothetical protein